MRAFQGGQSIFLPCRLEKQLLGFSRALGREDKTRQNLPGFEQFQSPPDVEQLMDLAEFGPLLQSMPSHSGAMPSSSRTTILEQFRSPELKWDELNANMKDVLWR